MSSYKWKIKYLKDYLYLTWDSWQMLQMETVYVYIFYIWYKWRPKSSSSLTAFNNTHKMFWSTVKQWFMKLMIMMIINGQAVSEMNKVLKFFFFPFFLCTWTFSDSEFICYVFKLASVHFSWIIYNPLASEASKRFDGRYRWVNYCISGTLEDNMSE